MIYFKGLKNCYLIILMKPHLIKFPQKYNYLIILDFEANCLEDKQIYPQEIIEFPCIVYDVQNDIINRNMDFSYFINPDIPITEFCTNLTSITQEMVNNKPKLNEILDLHKKWMIDNNLLNNSLFVTCGDWDLKTALPNHCKYMNIEYSNYFKEWCNIKKLFSSFYGIKSYGMKTMLDKLNISLEGTHHRGIDDCYNIAKIAQKMVIDGCQFTVTTRIK